MSNWSYKLRNSAAAVCLLISGVSAHAVSAISGVWSTDGGGYLMLVRDTAGTIVGLELGSDLRVSSVWTGLRLRTGVSVLKSLDAQQERTLELSNVADQTLSGTRSDGRSFSATRLLAYQDHPMNGIWKRDDGNLGYLFVFNGQAANGGLAVVSELFFRSGMPVHALALGKLTGNSFVDTVDGTVRLQLHENGKLAGQYTINPNDGYANDASGITEAATSGGAGGSSSSKPSSYTASRVLTGKDPDSAGSAVGTGPLAKGCAGNFGEIQGQVKSSITENLTKQGISPGWVVSKTKIGDVKVFDGGTVPNYRITYVTDVGTNLNKSLAKVNKTQNVFVSCYHDKSSGQFKHQVFYNTTLEAAEDFCASIKQGAPELALYNAAMSARGMNAESFKFEPINTTNITSGKVPLEARIILDTDTTFNTPETYPSDAYTSVKDACKSWFSYGTETPANPYPSWASQGPTGTPEFAVCMNPGPTSPIASKPGLFAMNISSPNSGITGYEAYIKHTTEADLSTLVPYQFTSVNEQGQTQVLQTNVPWHLVKPVDSAVDALDPGITSTCSWDSEAEAWFGLQFVNGAEPHTEACKSFNAQFKTQFKNGAYNGLYVTKSSVTLPNGDVMNLTPAEAMSVGMGMMTGAALAALGIGNFEPGADWTSGTLAAQASSKAKFISITPYFELMPTQTCVVTIPADPETGEPPVKECVPATTGTPTGLIAYTIEAPSCEP